MSKICLYYESKELQPTRHHSTDAGFDLYCKDDVFIASQHIAKVPTGVYVVMPEDFVGIIHDRSGVASLGVFIVGGVIDSGYRGEIHLLLYNSTSHPIKFNKHSRLAQIIFHRINTDVDIQKLRDKLPESDRGTKGFGSTGM